MSVNTQGKAKLGARSDSGACGPFQSFGSDRQTEPQAQLMDILVCLPAQTGLDMGPTIKD